MIPLRAEAHASGVEGGSPSRLRRSCDFSHETSSTVVEIGAVVGQEHVPVVVVVEGVSEGKTRTMRRAREAKDSNSSPGTVPVPLENNDGGAMDLMLLSEI